MADRDLKDSIIRQALRDATSWLERNTYLAPIIESHPVVVDYDMPRAMEERMREENSFCKTDGKYVYVLTENAYDVLTGKGIDPGDFIFNDAIRDELRCVLAKEYAHVVMQHTRQQRYFEKSDDFKKNTFAVACEIEANRSKGVDKDSTVYKDGLTDDTFPCTKGKKYLKQIYQALLEQYGDSIENEMSGEADENDEPQDAQNEPQDAQNQKDGDDTESDGKDAQNGSSKPTQQNNGLTDEQKSKLQKFASQKDDLSPLDGDNDLLMDGDNKDSGDDAGKMAGKDGEQPTINDLNEIIWKRWKAKQVRKEIRKLKGSVQGVLSRKKRGTYSRPTRRSIEENGLIRKGVAKDRSAMPKILVALDCSGSMESQKIKSVARAIGNIFEDLGRPTKGCKMCLFHHEIVGVAPMRSWKKFVETYQAWGGTDYDNVLELALKLDVDVVIEVGDGFCNFEDKKLATTFFESGRKWYDAVIIEPSDLSYCLQEVEADEKNNFHRELIFLDEETALRYHERELKANTEESLRVHSSKNFQNWLARRN